MAPPRARPSPDVPLARRLLHLLRLSARDERVPLLQPLRPVVVAALGRPRELPLPPARRPAGLAGGAEHDLADRGDGSAAGAVRVRHRDDGVARETRRRLLPYGLLPPRARTTRRGDVGVRLPAESRDRAGEHDPVEARDPGAALVPVTGLVEAVAHHARHL